MQNTSLFGIRSCFICYSSGCATISWSCCHNQDWHRHTDHNPHWLATWDQRLPLLSLSPPVATPLTLLLSLPCLSLCLHVYLVFGVHRFGLIFPSFVIERRAIWLLSPCIWFNSDCWHRGFHSANNQKLSSIRINWIILRSTVPRKLASHNLTFPLFLSVLLVLIPFCSLLQLTLSGYSMMKMLYVQTTSLHSVHSNSELFSFLQTHHCTRMRWCWPKVFKIQQLT